MTYIRSARERAPFVPLELDLIPEDVKKAQRVIYYTTLTAGHRNTSRVRPLCF